MWELEVDVENYKKNPEDTDEQIRTLWDDTESRHWAVLLREMVRGFRAAVERELQERQQRK